MSPEQQRHIDQSISSCRREIDGEIHEIRLLIESHVITEEQAEAIATRAAMKAKAMAKGEIRQEMIDDIKKDIGTAAIEMMVNALKMVAVFVVGLGFYLSGIKLPWK